MLLAGILTVAFNVQLVKSDYAWTEPIYVRADGGIQPSTAPISSVDNVTYTLTDNIVGNVAANSSAIIIQRDNIIIDGADHTLQETQAPNTTGIELTGISNVTIKNMNIMTYVYGIWFSSSSNNSVSGNNIANNAIGIELDSSSNNSVSGNNVTANYHAAIYLDSSSNNIVSGNNITANDYDGIYLEYSSDNNISGNNIANNAYVCIELDFSSNNNSVTGNNITANNVAGIWLAYSSDNSLSGNNIANNLYGIFGYSSSNNIVSGNNIANNQDGIYLEYSSNNNTVSGNNITADNLYGIWLDSSSNINTIYHNIFMNDSGQAYSSGSTNVWNDGYPSGGNFWSDYNGTDGNGDGIGDTPYVIDANNTDPYPLMAPYGMFDAGMWNGTACTVGVMSNSTVSAFQVDVAQETASFNVTGAEGSAGFCRVTIPNIIVQSLWQGNYTVLVDGERWPFSNWTDATNTYLYFNYTHSQHQTIIIPELPSLLTLPILMIMTLLAIIASRRKWSKHHHEES
jgi:parallel beta-helix repeat protein